MLNRGLQKQIPTITNLLFWLKERHCRLFRTFFIPYLSCSPGPGWWWHSGAEVQLPQRRNIREHLRERDEHGAEQPPDHHPRPLRAGQGGSQGDRGPRAAAQLRHGAAQGLRAAAQHLPHAGIRRRAVHAADVLAPPGGCCIGKYLKLISENSNIFCVHKYFW